MKNVNPLVLAVLFFCSMSLWGCNQQKSGAITSKIRELETRYTKLEEDYHSLQAANEQTRKRLNAMDAQRVALEKDKAELTQQLDNASTERETLRKQVSERTVERDSAQTSLIQFSKDLQSLAGRVEATVNNTSANPNATIIPASRRNE